MLYGIGTDIVEISRLEAALARNGRAFLERVLAPAEQMQYQTRGRNALAYLAGRWAGKEAVAKSFGTGFGESCSWTDIVILDNDAGKPEVTLTGNTETFAVREGIGKIHLSISHDGGYAVAFAAAEKQQQSGNAPFPGMDGNTFPAMPG